MNAYAQSSSRLAANIATVFGHRNYGTFDTLRAYMLSACDLASQGIYMGDHQAEKMYLSVFNDIADQSFHQQLVALCPVTSSEDVKGGATFASNKKFTAHEMVEKNPDKRFLEIGTAWFFETQKSHRSRYLIWQGLRHYCQDQGIDYMIGSLNLPARYPASHALAFSYLHHFCRADEPLRAKARDGVSMDMMPVEAIHPHQALSALPPQLRYCLRFGGKMGDGLSNDPDKEQNEVFVIIPTR